MTKANAAILNGDKIKTITLEEPIVRGDTEIVTLQLRRPSSGELRGLSLNDLTQSNVDSLIALLPRIAMPSIIENEASQLSPADLMQVATAVADFFMSRDLRAKIANGEPI